MSEQICRFCQRYVKLAYYCEDCGSNSCSDCLNEKKVDYFVCQDCKSRDIEVSESEKRKKCNICDSENIIKEHQLLKSCPKCNSHKIINIYEKKEELEKEFLELIKNTRSFINPLRDALKKLYLLQRKIKNARDPPIKCHHFPKMESDLLSLFKLFIYVQNTLFEKINVHFHQIVLYKEYFFDIYAQPNSNITIIESIFENLVRSYNSINEFISSNVKTFNDSIESFEINLKFINKISHYFTSYLKFLNLAEKEKPVYAIHAKLTNGLDTTQEKYKKDKGILFITNFDLSFVHEHGLVKKKKELIFKAPVNDLTRIKEKGRIIKKLYIEFEYGKYEFTLPPKAIPRVIEYILIARTFDETTIFDKKSALKLQEIDIDINDLESFIEESINSFFSLKCQYNKGYENLNGYNNFNQNPNFQPNQMPNIARQAQPHFNPYQNQNFAQIWPKNPTTPYPNNIGIPSTSKYFPSTSYPANMQDSPDQPPFGMINYRNPLKQYHPMNYEENNFFMQNLNNHNRYQNYSPERRPSYDDMFEEDLLIPDESTFQEYNRNHLSNLFDPNEISLRKSYKYKKKLFKLDKEKQEKMEELEKERYSLKATLKKLEAKFDEGLIAEKDYFKTYRNLHKEIYLIDKKIQYLRESLEELESIKQNSRSFDRKRYYT